ncbi:hypothetical protein PWEIH_02951 [Listeria weihenstephanensis FSL R9-0317]|uniref:Uncharacterized protein n=1 Tax=Listeria weihenstephanensis TaxID=1006155 RepID=A0A1S7FWZ0_9LIST|nr:hypothetical protein [Listeria weihenstephanensis]AQY51910.1 hypothetical protein UE46_13330 [Listeria weihenstephanensis]EUJ40701.1 hypothetical protein PWEIH_02951 [Listeria weihenstephanensis FSL R9-0317]
MKLKFIVAAVTLTVSSICPAFSTIVNADEQLPAVVFENDQISNDKDLYKLAQKQEQENIDDIKIAGEEIPLDLVDTESIIQTDTSEPENLDVSRATEVLLVDKTTDDDYSAYMTSTIFIEGDSDSAISSNLVAPEKAQTSDINDDLKVDNSSTYKNIGSNLVEKLSGNHKNTIFPTLIASWTDSKSSQKYDSGRNVLLTMKIYYHYQNKGGANHLDMNYVEYWTTPKAKGSSVGYRKLEFKQMGLSGYKSGWIYNTHASYPTSNHKTVNVPDSWPPVLTSNAFVGAKIQATIYGSNNKSYHVATTTMLLDNLGVNKGRGSW